MANTLSDVLNRWLYAEVFSAAELAAAADRAEKTIYGYAEGKRCPFDVAKRMARYASKRGYNHLARLLLDPAFEVAQRQKAHANGCLDDELGPMTQALGMARHYHQAGNRTGMAEQIAEAERQLHNLKAERDRL